MFLVAVCIGGGGGLPEATSFLVCYAKLNRVDETLSVKDMTALFTSASASASALVIYVSKLPCSLVPSPRSTPLGSGNVYLITILTHLAYRANGNKL